jgi:hypothetical protein
LSGGVIMGLRARRGPEHAFITGGDAHADVQMGI